MYLIKWNIRGKTFTNHYTQGDTPLDPDCYLKAARRFGLKPSECIVFEDSFNGLKSGRAAEMTVVGLSTTNSAEAISPLCDLVIPDYEGLDFEKFCEIVSASR